MSLSSLLFSLLLCLSGDRSGKDDHTEGGCYSFDYPHAYGESCGYGSEDYWICYRPKKGEEGANECMDSDGNHWYEGKESERNLSRMRR